MSFLRPGVKRNRVKFNTSGKKRVDQSYKKQCDINNIMKKYEKTGLITHTKENPMWGDFSNVDSYHESLNQVIKAKEAFATLSAKLRNRFDNDPAKLIAFLEDPANQEEAIKLKLIKAPPAPKEPAKEPEKAPEKAPAKEPTPSPTK